MNIEIYLYMLDNISYINIGAKYLSEAILTEVQDLKIDRV